MMSPFFACAACLYSYIAAILSLTLAVFLLLKNVQNTLDVYTPDISDIRQYAFAYNVSKVTSSLNNNQYSESYAEVISASPTICNDARVINNVLESNYQSMWI